MTEEEKKEILETYKWIKVPKWDPSEGLMDYGDLYFALLKHHEQETNFLINKIREIVKDIETKKEEH